MPFRERGRLEERRLHPPMARELAELRLSQATQQADGQHHNCRYNRSSDPDLAGNPRNRAPGAQPDLRGAGLCTRQGLALPRSPIRKWKLESRTRLTSAGEVAKESQVHAICCGARLHHRFAAQTVLRAAGIGISNTYWRA